MNPLDTEGFEDGSLISKGEEEYFGSGPERYFERGQDEVFDGSQFTLIFLDSDSVTNVTRLNRVNKRRVLLYIGNERGLISFGKGKAEDYERAFE